MILIYDAKTKKVVSINAGGHRAESSRRSSGIKQNLGGTLPDDDTLSSGTVPGVVDAWYTLLDRWGTMTFAQVLQPAIEMAEQAVSAQRGAGARR